MEIASVAVITVICYLVGMGLKAWDAFDDRKIPVIMGVCGALLGIICYIVAPDLLPAKDPVTAVAVGIVSGLAATGVNQIYKQSSQKFAFKYTDETTDELTNNKGDDE